MQKPDIEKIGGQVHKFIQDTEDIFCFSLFKDGDSYTISKDIDERVFDGYFCYFDPSPLLPSSLLKNYLVKLNKMF